MARSQYIFSSSVTNLNYPNVFVTSLDNAPEMLCVQGCNGGNKKNRVHLINPWEKTGVKREFSHSMSSRSCKPQMNIKL